MRAATLVPGFKPMSLLNKSSQFKENKANTPKEDHKSSEDMEEDDLPSESMQEDIGFESADDSQAKDMKEDNNPLHLALKVISSLKYFIMII